MFSQCFVKYFVICLVQGGVTFYSPDFADQTQYVQQVYFPLHLSFLFGFLVIGNCIDNLDNPKQIMYGCEICLGLVWIIQGVEQSIFQLNSEDDPKKDAP
jgi:hypothetical protein